LAAILFGDLAREGSGELFFLSGEHHYHVQRLFVPNRARLRVWEESSWRVLYDDQEAPSEEGYRLLMEKLCGVGSTAAFLALPGLVLQNGYLTAATDESISQELLQGLLTQDPATSGAVLLEKRRLALSPLMMTGYTVNQGGGEGEREEALREIASLTSLIQQTQNDEAEQLYCQRTIKALEQQQLRDQRQLQRLEELQPQMRIWQTSAQGYLQADAFCRQREASWQEAALLSEKLGKQRMQLLDLGQQMNTSPEVVKQRFDALQKRYRELIQEEEKYQKATEQLARYGPLPLPVERLLPLINRRLELLKAQTLHEDIQPPAGANRPGIVGFGALLGLLGGCLAYYFLRWEQPLWGVLFILTCGLVTAFFAARIAAQAPEKVEEGENLLRQELQEQNRLLGGIALMDPVALIAYQNLIQGVAKELQHRPDPGALHAAAHDLAALGEQHQELSAVMEETEKYEQQLRLLLSQQGATSLEHLGHLYEDAQSEREMELNSWRRFSQQHSGLPSLRSRDISTALADFTELQQQYQQLQHNIPLLEEEIGSLQQRSQALSSKEEANIANLQDALSWWEFRLQEIDDTMPVLRYAEVWLREVSQASREQYRQTLVGHSKGYLGLYPTLFPSEATPGWHLPTEETPGRLFLSFSDKELPWEEMTPQQQAALHLALRLAQHRIRPYALPLVAELLPTGLGSDITMNDPSLTILSTIASDRQILLTSQMLSK